MTLGKPDAGKPLVRFDEGRSETVIGLVPLQPVRSAYSTCAGEAGCHAGESPAGRIRLFTTESCVREEAVRPNPKARRGLNCPVVTTVNLID